VLRWNVEPPRPERNSVPPANVVKVACRVAKRDGATLRVIYHGQGVGAGDFF